MSSWVPALYTLKILSCTSRELILPNIFYFLINETEDNSVYRTYEMELQLDDPKSKEDDLGLILIDLCLMFQDATIKKGPVCVFLVGSIC